MAWIAVDRAVKAVERYGLKGPAVHWRKVGAQMHEKICRSGYDAERNTFTQSFGSAEIDASLLMLPLVGFLPATDRRVKGTVQAIESQLLRYDLVLRYSPGGGADGLPPGEGVFLPCSFWLVDNYVLQGRRPHAMELFERLLSLRSDVGLLAEEYSPEERRLLGNYPQAFTHVALINTAMNLTKSEGPAHARSHG